MTIGQTYDIIYIESEVRVMIELIKEIAEMIKEIALMVTAILFFIKSANKKGE